MDPQAPDNVLEVTARALTYYLDVSVDCTRRIIAVDGALKAIIERMQAADIKSRTSKDLAEQCVKVSGILLQLSSTGMLAALIVLYHSPMIPRSYL